MDNSAGSRVRADVCTCLTAVKPKGLIYLLKVKTSGLRSGIATEPGECGIKRFALRLGAVRLGAKSQPRRGLASVSLGVGLPTGGRRLSA